MLSWTAVAWDDTEVLHVQLPIGSTVSVYLQMLLRTHEPVVHSGMTQAAQHVGHSRQMAEAMSCYAHCSTALAIPLASAVLMLLN